MDGEIDCSVEGLSAEQLEALHICGEYLGCDPFSDEEVRKESFDLLGECQGCVPDGYVDDLMNNIRKKFVAIIYPAIELAHARLRKSGDGPIFLHVIDASYEDSTVYVVVDYHDPICYLNGSCKAWHWKFESLAEVAESILGYSADLVRMYRATKGDVRDGVLQS